MIMKSWEHVFKALPHIDKIWVTKDGNFHLHPYNGGEKINRISEKDIKSENKESEEEIEEQKPRSKGRPKLN
ncbi:MAG: hypothetical protein WC886_05760 [Saccharofermentanaceae bacterium]